MLTIVIDRAGYQVLTLGMKMQARISGSYPWNEDAGEVCQTDGEHYHRAEEGLDLIGGELVPCKMGPV